jgi:hypothetical protein
MPFSTLLTFFVPIEKGFRRRQTKVKHCLTSLGVTEFGILPEISD